MQSADAFDAEKLSFLEFKLIKGQIDVPEEFDLEKIEAFEFENNLEFSINVKEKRIKADFTIDIKTISNNENKIEASASFHFRFTYEVTNLEDLNIIKDNNIMLEYNLGSALSSITYSTARGILLTRLQGTALQKFILPIIKPIKLLPLPKEI